MSESALAGCWAGLRTTGRPALIPYLTAGHPDRATSLAALRMLAEEGADIVEVGIPFSDPLADGPVIQRSSDHALRGGTTVAGVLNLVREAALDRPVVAFSYLNPLLAYGLPRFLEDAARAGIAGVLITDLPVGADPAIEQQVRASPLDLIRLVALTTTRARLRVAGEGAEGFLYLISRLGVTGTPTEIGAAVEGAVRTLREVSTVPIAVGFGIRRGDQARQVARFADGVVVGSALVERLERGLDAARELMHELRAALDAPAPVKFPAP